MTAKTLGASAWPPSSIPARLYKYTTGDRAKQVVRDNVVYFCSPRDFNDPFDCRIPLSFTGSEDQYEQIAMLLAKRMKPGAGPEEWRRMVKGAKRRFNEGLARRIFQKWQREILDQSGVLCLSEKSDDILMWSHYAGAHTGACLAFEPDSARETFGVPLPVDYRDDFPEVRFTSVFSRGDEFFRDGLVRFGRVVFITKASHWRYEREWRFIDFALDAQPRLGLRALPARFLSGVILGCRMDEREKQEIRRLVASTAAPITVYEAIQKDRTFGLEVVPVR